MPGVNGVAIDMAAQKVTVSVDPSVDPTTVKDTVAKTGKATEFWQ
jgi:copper chaperone CopZ